MHRSSSINQLVTQEKINSLISNTSLTAQVKRKEGGVLYKVEGAVAPNSILSPDKAYIMIEAVEENCCSFALKVGNDKIGELDMKFYQHESDNTCDEIEWIGNISNKNYDLIILSSENDLPVSGEYSLVIQSQDDNKYFIRIFDQTDTFTDYNNLSETITNHLNYSSEYNNRDFENDEGLVKKIASNLGHTLEKHFSGVGQVLEEFAARIAPQVSGNNIIMLKSLLKARGFHYMMGCRAIHIDDMQQNLYHTDMRLDSKKAPSGPDSPRKIYGLLHAQPIRGVAQERDFVPIEHNSCCIIS